MKFFKKLDKKKKEKLKKHSKKIGIFIIIAIIILISFLTRNKEEDSKKQEIEKVQKRTIQNSISGSGKIKAENSKAVVSSSIGLKVERVYVKEGDIVSKGDLIAKLDTSSLERELNEIRNANREINNISSEEELQNAKNELEDVRKNLKDLRKELNDSKEVLKNKEKDLENYKNTYEEEKALYDAAVKEVEDKKRELEIAQNSFDAENEKPDSEKDFNLIAELEIKLQEKRSQLAISNNKLIDAEVRFNPIKLKEEELQNAKNDAENEVSRKEGNLNLLEQREATLSGRISILENVSSNSGTSLLDSQISSLEKQIEDASIKAPASGTITSIGVSEGDTYLGTVICKIEGIESFIVEAEIDEYDIPDIKIGQVVKIKTDATRDEELKGYVTYIAISATESESLLGDLGMSSSIASGSNKASFKIEVSIETDNDRLRIGMTARINIITEEKENVLSLPADSIREREDGTKYVEKIVSKSQESDEIKTEEVDVTIGIEGTYYIEVISEGLKEGDEVIVPETKSDSSLKQIIDSMGSGAGI